MKKLLASSALAVIAMTGAASAQSVLERVLGQISNGTNLASVNGTFANIAENIGGRASEAGFSNGVVTVTESEFDALVAAEVARVASGYMTANGPTAPTPPTELLSEPLTTDDQYIGGESGSTTFDQTAFDQDFAAYEANAIAWSNYNTSNSNYQIAVSQAQAAANSAGALAGSAFAEVWQATTIEYPGVFGVDGSINTTVVGVSAAVAAATQFAQAGQGVTAYEFNLPTIDIGDLSTTALGAVNTGDITLGVNSAVDEAKTSATQAVSSVMTQLGGSIGSGALVLNIASNMTGVNGSITTVMSDVNGSINSAATTALGAVNTGTIVSGVNAAVQGIVGVSGQ